MNKEEFSKFYDDNIDKVFRFTYLRVDSAETAQDLTSQVFFRFWQETSRSPKKIKNPVAFLYRMARNKIIDFYRQKKKKPLSLDKVQEIADFQVAHTTFRQKIELNWEMEKVKRSLQSLPPLYADIIIWRHLDGLSYKEIAEILKKKEGAVRVLLHRALKELKERLSSSAIASE